MRWGPSAALAGLLTVALVGGGLAGCQEDPDRRTIALLLGSGSASRWEEIDEPTIRARVEEACDGCQLVVRSAEGDAPRQADQLDEVLDDGAAVVILNAVDPAGAEELVERAGSVPVVAYDRFVAGADWFVGVDAAAVGRMQGAAVVRALGGRGRALVVNGATGDPNAAASALAARAVLDESGIRVRAKLDPRTGEAAEAGDWVTEQLAPGRDPLGGVGAILVAGDVQAGGVVDALRAAKLPAAAWPVITGQDAELEAVRRIVRGEQLMTVLKPIVAEAERAADIAVHLITQDGDAGEDPEAGKSEEADPDDEDSAVSGAEDYEGVPSFVLEPVGITLMNLTDTVVRQGIHSIEEICDAATMPRCVALGIA
ncbi:substrate-binding domain-containing protein [Nocardioides pacificus]